MMIWRRHLKRMRGKLSRQPSWTSLPKITFPIPGTLKGHTASKPVMELKGVYFAYDEQDGPNILQDVTRKITMNSRVGIVGANGAGKSTSLNLLCGELSPSPSPAGTPTGKIMKHRNWRLACIAQQRMSFLGEFMNSSLYVHIQRRYENGWDEALQRRLIEPAGEEERALRKKLADREQIRKGRLRKSLAALFGARRCSTKLCGKKDLQNSSTPVSELSTPFQRPRWFLSNNSPLSTSCSALVTVLIASFQ